ncbi:MAG TPA: PilZ domain-containing protein [Bryobacteraceae bacterium]|jgi:hypothetical protein|nr:PilZ domain-containing protein [Bryobacteraceae bacterium]
MNISVAEKRREYRRPASGIVHLKLTTPRPFEVVGRLLDISDGGFRMTHSYTPLAAGHLVDFRHHESSGRARVVWNRILGDRVETGFVVVEP